MWTLTFIDYKKRKVLLSKERWNHIQYHEEAPPTIEEIMDVLAYPTTVRASVMDGRIRYYHYNKKYKKYVLVVVSYINLEGCIITSHFTSKIK